MRRLLKEERATWFAKCPKGHFLRHDECDLVTCYLTTIEPFDTPLLEYTSHTATSAPTHHQWVVDELVDQQAGWWWRVVYQKWLAFKKWATKPIAEEYP